MSETTFGPETAEYLQQLRNALQAIHLPYNVASAPAARQKQDELVKQLDDYVIPRVQRLNAPLLVVVGGSTGAGKSTLVNGLVGKPVTRAGAIRPTTRQPILLHNPADEEWFSNTRILPGLARIRGSVVQNAPALRSSEAGETPDASKIHSLVLVADPAIPQGLAILDAPDVDSVADENRILAKQLLAAADLWLFVTTANRYADAVPWEILQQAAERNTTVAVVLDRIQPNAINEISADLASHLVRRGLADAQLFVVEEYPLDAQGMLPPQSIAPIRGWLVNLAGDTEAKTAVMRRTLDGAIASLLKGIPQIDQAAKDQILKDDELRHVVVRYYDEAIKNIIESTHDGMLLRGELLSRWQDFVGTGDFFREFEQKLSFFRDKVTSFITGKQPPTKNVEVALESGLLTVMLSEADKAAQNVSHNWNMDPAGRELLGGRDLTRASDGFKQRAEAEIRDWQQSLLDLVMSEGEDKRQKARMMSFGVNGVATALMIVVFASTAGLSGAEVVIAGGGAAVGQKILESVFGEEAVRRLASKARKDLSQRCVKLMHGEATRFTNLLDQEDINEEAPEQLERASSALGSVVGISPGDEINQEAPAHNIHALKTVEQVPNALEQIQGTVPNKPSAKPIQQPGKTKPREVRRVQAATAPVQTQQVNHVPHAHGTSSTPARRLAPKPQQTAQEQSVQELAPTRISGTTYATPVKRQKAQPLEQPLYKEDQTMLETEVQDGQE
ncbi:MAG: dynamin family protein [Micrococcaceae bacterium]